MSSINGKYYNQYPAIALRALYEDPGFRLQDVATALGVSRQSVGYYMDGTNQPTIENLIRLADYFGVSTEYMLGRTESRHAELDLRIASEVTGLSDQALTVLAFLKQESLRIAKDMDDQEGKTTCESEEKPSSDAMQGTFIDMVDLILTAPSFPRFLELASIANALYKIAELTRLRDIPISDTDEEAKYTIKPMEYYLEPVVMEDGAIDTSGSHSYEAIRHKAHELICDIADETMKL